MENYEINEDTYAVIAENTAKSKIIEKEKEYSLDKDAYSIMDESCQYYGSSYNGRLKAAKKILDCSYKLPILVEESSCLIFFPIKSSLVDDCCWLNLNSIKKIEKVEEGAKITFINEKELIVDVSKLSLDNQIYRATRLESIIRKRISLKKGD